MLDWVRELLAPGGRPDRKVWEKLLQDLADKIIASELGMTSLGNFDFIPAGLRFNIRLPLGFDVPSKDGNSFLKTFGIYDVIDDSFETKPAGRKVNGVQPVKIYWKLWGLTKRGWLLIDVEFDAQEEGDEYYFQKPVCHQGRYVELEELLRLVRPRDILIHLETQISDWYRDYFRKYEKAKKLAESTDETIKFTHSFKI